MRIGIGYDSHRLVKDRKLILGGVNIPNELGLLGHSDADVLLHAISDAILGSIGAGDIGTFFPDTDPKYKDLDSKIILRKTLSILKEKDYEINNIDCVIIAEEPKLAPYYEKIKESIARLLEIEEDEVSIKSKTKEGMQTEILSIEVFAILLVIKTKL